MYLCISSGLFSSAYAQDMLSPDGKKSYKCGDEALSSDGCRKFWCSYYKGAPPTSSSESIWDSCVVDLWQDANGDYQGLASDGGVPWWYWRSGKLSSGKLEGFIVRDYEGPGNETNLGDVFSISGKPGCFRTADSSRTFCMVPIH